MNVYTEHDVFNFIVSSNQPSGKSTITFDIPLQEGDKVKVISMKEHNYFYKKKVLENLRDKLMQRAHHDDNGELSVSFGEIMALLDEEAEI